MTGGWGGWSDDRVGRLEGGSDDGRVLESDHTDKDRHHRLTE